MFDTNKDGKVSLSEYLGKYKFTQQISYFFCLSIHSILYDCFYLISFPWHFFADVVG